MGKESESSNEWKCQNESMGTLDACRKRAPDLCTPFLRTLTMAIVISIYITKIILIKWHVGGIFENLVSSPEELLTLPSRRIAREYVYPRGYHRGIQVLCAASRSAEFRPDV
jgi:hypothetical protein